MSEAGIESAELCRRAKALGGSVDAPRITRLLKDERTEFPTVPLLLPVAEALGVNVRWLWDGEGERYTKPPPGRVALEEAFRTIVWPTPTVVEAADVATRRARAEADLPAGRERVVSVWMVRLLQLYAEALAMPAGVAGPSALDEPNGKRAHGRRRSVRLRP